MLKSKDRKDCLRGIRYSASLVISCGLLLALSPIALIGQNVRIIIENSSDLAQWETLHTETVSSDLEKNFYRAKIETILPTLSSTTLEVTQSWSQETDYARLAYVEVPTTDSDRYPVLILLHGFGGNPLAMMNHYAHYSNHIRIALAGYQFGDQRSWNIGYEPSKADDIAFLRAILGQLKNYSNVDSSNITLLGTSNGAALVNKAIVELPIDTFQKAVTIASGLIEDQYRDDQFWYDPNQLNNYNTTITPALGRKIINFHGTNDSVVPYEGGLALGRTFWSAQESTYIYARAMGYNGPQLSQGTAITGTSLLKYSYLDDSVIHYEAIGDNHSLSQSSQIMQTIIENFIN